MFNAKYPQKRFCDNNPNLYVGEHSYITFVKWNDFCNSPQRYLEHAVFLKEHIDENSDYEYFKFKYAETVADAYMTECRNFHDFPNENNKNHPAKPEDYVGKCPVCSE